MLPLLATLDELEVRVGENVTDAARAEAILAAASTLVRAEVGRTWVDAAGDLVDDIPDAISQVVVEVAARVWRNPEGYTQRSTGPYSASVAAWAALGLQLTAGERAMLAGTGPSIGLSSVRVLAPAAARPTRLGLPLELDDEP
jgi:hypothetical protein